MAKLADVFNLSVVGASLAIAFYWVGILLNRLSTNAAEFKWWLKVVVPQGVVLALALKLFKVF